MNHYYTRLSFEKLENFDMQRRSLRSFVLIRNSLITALTMQQEYVHNTQQQLLVEQEQEEQQPEEEVWLDSCFTELQPLQERSIEDEDMIDTDDDDYYYDNSSSSEEDDVTPLSPQDDNDPPFYKKRFYINDEEEDEEDGLVCYDIPFLSLVNDS